MNKHTRLVALLGVLVAALVVLLLGATERARPAAPGGVAPAVQAPAADTELSAAATGPARATPPDEPRPAAEQPIIQDFPPPPPNALLFEQGRPDPIETGECELVVLLLDLASGAPAASGVTLWRLDAPDSVHWTRGDQAQQRAQVPIEGHTFEGLAEGRYRLVCYDERHEAPDPESFVVSGPRTHLTLYLDLPVPRPAFALLFDEDGTALTSAEVSSGARRGRHVTVGARPWVAPRRQKRPDDSMGSGGAGAGFFGTYGGRREWRAEVADAGGRLYLGEFPGDPRDARTRYVVELRLADQRRASVEVHAAHGGEPQYVVVFPWPTAALESIELPDGRDGRAIAERVDVHGGSLLLDDALTRWPWREVPIHVRIEEDEQLNWEFSYVLDDLPLEPFRLTR